MKQQDNNKLLTLVFDNENEKHFATKYILTETLKKYGIMYHEDMQKEDNEKYTFVITFFINEVEFETAQYLCVKVARHYIDVSPIHSITIPNFELSFQFEKNQFVSFNID